LKQSGFNYNYPAYEKYHVEFIGIFFLVLTVGMTVIEPGAGAPGC
jgi:hypothetical protein